MKLTTLKEKLDSIGYDAAAAEVQAGRTELTAQFEEAQAALALVFKSMGIAAEDFYFNPQDSYIRLADHAERRLHKNTWMCLDMERSSDTAMAMSLLGIRFESTRYIQDVKPQEQNLIICAETLEYFAELMRAFEDQDLVTAYIGIVNEYWGHVISDVQRNKKNQDIVGLGKKYTAAAEYVTRALLPCGIDVQEDAEEYFSSMYGGELLSMWEAMGSPGKHSNKSEELRETILEFFVVDETKLPD